MTERALDTERDVEGTAIEVAGATEEEPEDVEKTKMETATGGIDKETVEAGELEFDFKNA